MQQPHHLIQVVQELSLAREIPKIAEIVRVSARSLTGADGATFILREGEQVHYFDEDAIAPLWKGRRFPMESCISGWAILHREQVCIEDIYQDARVPHDAYLPTFVKSLAMTPVRKVQPLAAIGVYWAQRHRTNDTELSILQALADSTSIALENVRLYSEMNHALVQAKQATAALSRQLDLRDEFLAIAAHELQTPLTPLKLQIQYLRKNMPFPTNGIDPENPIKKSFKIIHRQIDFLTERVDQMLDVSMIRLGKLRIETEPSVPLNDLIAQAIEECREENTRILIQLDPGIFGFWDRKRLLQALKIILRNAIRFGGNKPIEISSSISADAHARITVKDHGIGIAPSEQARIFDRFERAHSVQSYGGLGLGLFIARTIIESHHGTLSVESAPQQGSAFSVSLPLKTRPP